MKKVKATKTEAQKKREHQKKLNTMIEAYIHIFKDKGKVLSEDMKEYGYSYDMVYYYFGGLTSLGAEARKLKPKEFFNIEKRKKSQAEKEAKKIEKRENREEKIDAMCAAYADIVDSKGYASMQDMVDAGYTKDTITYYFGSLTKLNSLAREQYPDCFFDMDLDEIIHDKDNRKRLSKALKNKKRFIITTAVTGCKANYAALDSIKNYCTNNDAHVLVLSASDPAHNVFAKDAGYGTLDEALVKNDYCSVVPYDIQLNSNVSISTVKMSAKQIDPATSMKRIAAKQGTFIFASPKQRMAPVPVSNKDLPYFVMGSGAITVPDYASTSYMSSRTAFLAQHDHVMGGLIVEIVDDNFYHFRQFQISDDDSIVDLGVRYYPDGSTASEQPEAFVLGDWHSGETDPTARKSWEDIIDLVKPKKLIIHDGFNGTSINHHERFDTAARAKLVSNKMQNLRQEIEGFARDLDELSRLVEELVVVKSNHDEFLDRYLASGYYVKDPENHRYSLDLAAAQMDGEDPLQYAVERMGILSDPNKIRWLDRDEDFKIAEVQLGCHGDLGPNGARGSIKNTEAIYTNSITGHSHSPEILRNSYQVGTSSYLKLSYNRGSSSWLHTSCLLYKDGSKQLINSILGKWRL